METLTIEILNPKAKKLIDNLIDLELISLRQTVPTWNDFWDKLDAKLPQTEPEITEAEITAEIKSYRAERNNKAE